MSLIDQVCPVTGECFPRVSGDEPKKEKEMIDERSFSPRERG